MPLYEYECQACHRRTEKRQKFSDPEITVCPHCGGHLVRVLSAPAISFKGGGWYADGYGNAKPKSASGEAGASGDAKSSGEGGKPSGEAKPGPSPAEGSKSPTSAESSGSGTSTTPAATPAPSSPAPSPPKS